MININETPLATKGQRLLAYLIDIFPILIMTFAIFYFFLGFDQILEYYLNRGSDIQPRIDFLKERNRIRNVSFIIWVIYCLFMESSKEQGTFGKKIMGIKVVSENGKRLSTQDSIKRNLFKIVSFSAILLGFIWIVFDKRNQGWHDKTAKTLVVRKRDNPD